MRRCAANHAGLLSPGKRAFTLVEMLVSLAVLSIALGVVGYVFSATINATRQAAAYSEAHNLTQQLVNQLEEDLRNCDPANSLLVLVGRTQAAARTKDDLDARKFWRVLVGDPANVPANFDPEYTRPSGKLDPATYQYSDPRADILMFFSNRPTMSQAPHRETTSTTEQTFNDQCLQGVRFSPIQVVYGHAALDTAKYESGRFVLANNPQHIEENHPGAGTRPESLSKLPLTAWHLSRRATILVDYPPGQSPPSPRDIQFSRNAYENIVSCMPYEEDDGEKMPGDAARLDWRRLLAQFGPNTDHQPNPLQSWFSPYEFLGSSWDNRLREYIWTLMYKSGTAPPELHQHHVASVVENPPPDLASNMGVHLLPGCAWFQVEFLMPEDPRNSLYYHDPEPSDSSKYSKRWDMPRWTEVEAGRTYVFIPDTAENRNHVAQLFASSATGAPDGRLRDFARVDPTRPDTVDNRVIRMWPYAIRITVRVFDRQGRLEQPIVRSIVHRFD